MPERSLAADAGTSVSEVVTGPPRTARVLAAFPTAVYLLPDGGRAVAVEAADGVGLPNALRLHLPAAGLQLAALPCDAPATIGDGRLEVAGLVVVVDGWVDHTYRPAGVDVPLLRGRLDLVDAALLAAEPLGSRVADRVAELEVALTTGSVDALADAGRALIGLGGGLTPTGDDVLCGVLSGGRTFARSLHADQLDRALQQLGAALSLDAAERTTTLSAALLWHAARAELARPARDLLRGLLGRTPVGPATTALLAVGHSSGRDLAIGLGIGIRAALAAAARTTAVPTTGVVR